MIEPPLPACFMRLPTCWVIRKVPTRFTSTTSRNTSSGNSSNGPETSGGALGWVSTPALLTRPSGTPHFASMLSSTRLMLALSVIFTSAHSRRSESLIAPSTRSTRAASTRVASAATFAPRSCNVFTYCAPSCPRPPVTMMTLSLTENNVSSIVLSPHCVVRFCGLRGNHDRE